MVMGSGRRRAIMLVGDGPNEVEEGMGIPLVDASGEMLKTILGNLDIENSVYTTNIVSCRSCRQRENDQGQPMMQDRGGYLAPWWEDSPPPKPCLELCRPRLMQEIYIVDPVVIVALGGTAIEVLAGHTISVKNQNGKIEAETIGIPGVGFRPSLTEKRGQWVRSYSTAKGFTLPTIQNVVSYLMIPAYPQSFVRKRLMDESDEGPFNTLTNALRTAANIYERCMIETRGYVPQMKEDENGD